MIFGWLLAAVGATTILTRGSIFATLRDRTTGWCSSFVHCPLCVGFWVGAFFSLVFGPLSERLTLPLLPVLANRLLLTFADACLASFASAIGVAVWQILGSLSSMSDELRETAYEGRTALSLWRHKNEPQALPEPKENEHDPARSEGVRGG